MNIHAAARFWKSLRFQRPPRAELLVFDAAGSEVLAATALRGLPHAVLDARMEVVYAAPRILLRCLLNLRLLPSFRPGQLYTAYLLSCLQDIRPKAVVTFVDNSEYFHGVARFYPGARFFAVQNGFRSEASVSSSDKHPAGWMAPGAVMRIPHFFCFGRFEEDLYRRLGHEVGRFEPLGSLRAGYYKTEVAPSPPPQTHELCLVSEWDAAIMSGELYPSIRRGVERLNELLRRYVEETGATLLIAGRSRDPRERETYAALFGARAEYVENVPAAFSSYRTMDAANLIISLYSTAAFEAFGWGKKTIFCNLSGDETLSCPIKGPWSFTGAGYEEFKDTVDRFRRMTSSGYAELAGETARYMMAFDPARPAHRVIRERVVAALKEGSS